MTIVNISVSESKLTDFIQYTSPTYYHHTILFMILILLTIYYCINLLTSQFLMYLFSMY